jgi:glycosyltransferase involved in cell wall biosynthesis
VRICIVYDCLYPYTVGGAERWYRNLARRLAEDGHEVTYLTMRQWADDEHPDVPGVRVVTVAPRMKLYTGSRRRILPPILFGAGVLAHLLRHGWRYEVVHTASFPYFSLLAAALVRPLARYRLFVDWHELWTREYWREYLGPIGGRIGWGVQQLCLGVPQRAFCFSQLVERRLVAQGLLEVTVLEGQFEGTAVDEPLPPDPVVVFAGRHIPEKNPVAVVHAIAKARETMPGLRAVIYGEGPERPEVLSAIAVHGLEEFVKAPGFVDGSVIQNALSRALCLVLPSRREGYGLVVLEAMSRGTPTILTEGDDNASVEFIVEGVNGFLASSAGPEELAAAITLVQEGGLDLRRSTLDSFNGSLKRRGLARSLQEITTAYEEEPSADS